MLLRFGCYTSGEATPAYPVEVTLNPIVIVAVTVVYHLNLI